MNRFLKHLSITFRRDPNNYRPRINKMDSQKDREQKASGNYFFMEDWFTWCDCCNKAKRIQGTSISSSNNIHIILCQVSKTLPLLFILKYKCVLRFFFQQKMNLWVICSLQKYSTHSIATHLPYQNTTDGVNWDRVAVCHSGDQSYFNSFSREYTATFPESSDAFGSIHFSLQGETPLIVI